MWYVAMILRILIILVWIQMMNLSGWTPNTPPFCSGVGFILIWVYFALLSIVGPKKMLCPIKNCVSDTCKK